MKINFMMVMLTILEKYTAVIISIVKGALIMVTIGTIKKITMMIRL